MNKFRPRAIQFEGLSVCNARCTFCPGDSMTRKRGEMSDELFHKIIQEGKALGTKMFTPFLNGEPFLHSKIFEWLDYMQEQKVCTNLYTNGALLTKEKIDRLVKYNNIRHVVVSINAATKEMHKKITNLDNFDEIVENTRYLKSKAPFHVIASFVAVEENKHEMKQFSAMFKGYNHIGTYINWAGYKHDPIEANIIRGTRIFCHHLKNMYVLWDGRVCLCCFDYDGRVILGDLNKQSIKEVWDNAVTIRDRHEKLDFDMPLCRGCNLNGKK